MGHYRPRRPRLHEDPFKMVGITCTAVDKIRKGAFRGFSHWTAGVPTPEVHHERRMARLKALNHNVKPRLGVSVAEARNHALNINSMVNRIINRESTVARSKDPHNFNTHQALLRRPLDFGKKKKKVEIEPMEQPSLKKRKKRKKEWCDTTVTDWLSATNHPLKKLAPTESIAALKPDHPGAIAVRKGTPLCYSPYKQTKLVDGTHLCDRYKYNDPKSRKRYFSGDDNIRLKKHYKEVIDNPQGLATLTTKPWKPPPPPPLTTYDPQWSIDMRLGDIPSDLKATPNRHTLDDPLRPCSSSKPYINPLVEPEAYYLQELQSLPVPCNTPRSGYSSARSTRHSSRSPPGSRACSSVRHVHRADLNTKSDDPLSDEMSYRFGEMIRNLLPPPDAEQPSPSEIDELEELEEEIEAYLKAPYKPTDVPPWEYPDCCINPY
ncbi:hypothetical protein MPTK1_3g03350 [Marchantia polymorpha subsp. ruderalis]|nr:hypothetical protein MARPO_0244s0004 [Marchantia polymorpha]BBN04285.1 hypothetical protein Mp_3g03350 [Marchantia polymorpha subsp. ruderalis]|eukprot:PTQ27009.1 hypothetical protein MARPO_0244s0004 [Marchantia polymorpha]